jgi:hypothetical protein
MDLSRWSSNDYQTSFLTDLMLRLGANPYRCEYCRVNFVSFRKRKERYSPQRRKQKRKGSHPEAEQTDTAFIRQPESPGQGQPQD